MNRRVRPLITATVFWMSAVAVTGPFVTAQPPSSAPNPAPAEPAPAGPPRTPRKFVTTDAAFRIDVPNDSKAREITNLLRAGQRQLIDPSTKKPSAETKAALDHTARAVVADITHREYYTPPEPTKSELRPVPFELTLQSRIDQFRRSILVASKDAKFNADQSDYMKWYGYSVDAALQEILDPKPKNPKDAPLPVPQVYQVNAMRLLAIACESGSPAHVPTVLKYLSDPKCPPELLIWAIHAAEALFAAYEPISLNTNRYHEHTISNADMIPLILALEAIVTRTTPYGYQPPVPKPATAPPADKTKTPAPAKEGTEVKVVSKVIPPAGQLEAEIREAEQLRTIRFFRRAAIKALAQCRLPEFKNEGNGTVARPLLTLAKVATGDAAVSTAPGYDEIAYAVVGLCNIHRYRGVNPEVWTACIAHGVENFAQKKSSSKDDKSIMWKRHSAEMAAAITELTKLQLTGSSVRLVPKLAEIVTDRVLTPLDRIATLGNQPNLQALRDFRNELRIERMQLFTEVPGSLVQPAFNGQ